MEKRSFRTRIKITFILLNVISACGEDKCRKIQISSPDEKQYITIITVDDNRYIMNGKHDKILSSNCALVDISKVSKLGDEVGICWKAILEN